MVVINRNIPEPKQSPINQSYFLINELNMLLILMNNLIFRFSL